MKDITRKNKPLISVIMSAFNSANFLEESIKSILDQSFKNFEFIIVNDASTDQTEKIILKYKKKDKRIIYLKNKIN